MDNRAFIIKNILQSYFTENRCYNKKNYKREHLSKKINLLLKFYKRKFNKIPRVENYFQIATGFDSDIFYSHFRMDKNNFQAFVNLLRPHWDALYTGFGRPKDLEEKLLITLWALSNRSNLRELSDRFNKSISTISCTIQETTTDLQTFVKIYKISKTLSEIDAAVLEFNSLRGINSFPNVVGCIDGMHVRIIPPKEDPSSYYNRKGFHSMILQAICDAKGKFIDIFFGWPGRAHDAAVFQQSSIGRSLQNRSLKLPDDVNIVGDSAYPLSTFLMVPFKDNGHLSKHQKHFNWRLSSTRVLIEQSFGILKAKSQILDKLPFMKLTSMKYVVLACVILHNFIKDFDPEFPEEIPQNVNTITENAVGNVEGENISKNAKEKRENICILMYS